MFFKKNHTTTEKTLHTLSKPIYILGDSGLALFLTAKLQENNQNSILLTTSAPVFSYKNIEVSLKEEYNLQKSNLIIKATAHIEQEPAAILIAANNNSFRSQLTLLPSKSYQDIPIICFNNLFDIEAIRPLFGNYFYKAYFNGYLIQNGTNLTACGLQPEIILTLPKKQEEKGIAENILGLTKIKISSSEKDAYNFWKTHASRILGYLATSNKQPIMDILNSKQEKENLLSAIREICLLAKYEKVKLSEDDIIKELLETPRNFYYKDNALTKIENASFLEKLYGMLSEKARTYKCKIPELNQLIKKNYDYLLKK